MKDRKTRISEQRSIAKAAKEPAPKQTSAKKDHFSVGTTMTVTQQPKPAIKQRRKIVFRTIQSGDKMEIMPSYT